MTNRLYYGDNLRMLRDCVASETAYLDPLFSSQPNIPLVDPSVLKKAAKEQDAEQHSLFS